MFEDVLEPLEKRLNRVVARYEIEQRIEDPLRRFFYIRVKAHLIDGSYVDISRRISREEDVFSCFWIRKDGKVIGWNDYPHHPEIPTFPYHEHEYCAEYRKLRPSEIKNVEEAPSKIEEEMFCIHACQTTRESPGFSRGECQKKSPFELIIEL